MIIAYFSNFLNHHQKLVADELASTEGIDYIFVETVPMYDWLKKGGYTDYSQVSYVLRAWENEENRQKAIELAKTADVALFGGPEVLYLEVIRAKNTDKISFEVSERWLKRGWLNYFLQDSSNHYATIVFCSGESHFTSYAQALSGQVININCILTRIVVTSGGISPQWIKILTLKRHKMFVHQKLHHLCGAVDF